jgi:hypothetical protein
MIMDIQNFITEFLCFLKKHIASCMYKENSVNVL